MTAQRWETVSLNQVCEVIPGFAFKSQYLGDTGIPLVRIGDILEDATVALESCARIEDIEIDSRMERYLLEDRDMVLAMTGATAGKIGRIRTNQKVLLNQRVAKIKPIKIDPDFLWLVLNTKTYRDLFYGLGRGAAQPNISGGQIEAVEIPLPPDQIQRRIASILSAYDDLIENNRRRIALLEESARELYKEWFVRLRFPGYEHTKIINGVPARRSAFRHAGVPEGWEKKMLGELCTEIRDIVSPEDIDPDTPYIGLEHIPRRSITLDEWGYASDVTSSKHRFVGGDILFAKIRPYFHKVGIALLNGVASSDAIIIRSNELNWSLVLLTVSSDGFVADTSQRMKEGSKMPRADWKQMQQYTILTPPETLMKSLNAIVKPIADQLRVLTFQNKNLAEARDILLPKLMNGEIEVPEKDKRER